jgi:flagellar protein FlaI
MEKAVFSAVANKNELASYIVYADLVPGFIRISYKDDEFVPIYDLSFPKFKKERLEIIDKIKTNLIAEVKISMSEILDPKMSEVVKQKFFNKALEIIMKSLPTLSREEGEMYSHHLLHEMLGLGSIEMMLADDEIEEIVINSSDEPVWVFHKKLGWLKSNVIIKNESDIYNFSASIGRKGGREVTNLNPLMDARLTSGDRVNATLFPISAKGNTITIRKFSRKPFTITHLMKMKTVETEVLALLWMAIEYEMNIIIAGGTATGKTTFLNALMAFIPPNQRIISVEDTRELNLPASLHWVPLLMRESNPEGKGEVTMLDLVVNSLRMRPDRIIVGEIRRHREAEVLFEAMHTGHSVCATLHANTSQETLIRITNPPISVPESMVAALDLILIVDRQRKDSVRRLSEITEVLPFVGEDGKYHPKLNTLFKFQLKTGELEMTNRSQKLFKVLQELSGLSIQEINANLHEKKLILDWLVKNNVITVNSVGKAVAEYYKNKENVMKIVRGEGEVKDILGKFVEELE